MFKGCPHVIGVVVQNLILKRVHFNANNDASYHHRHGRRGASEVFKTVGRSSVELWTRLTSLCQSRASEYFEPICFCDVAPKTQGTEFYHCFNMLHLSKLCFNLCHTRACIFFVVVVVVSASMLPAGSSFL